MLKTPRNKITVLIVDDCCVSRYGVTSALSNSDQIKVISEAQNGAEAINYLKNNLVDVILMDLRMPGITGVEATRRILRNNPGQKILVLSSVTEGDLPANLLTLGVSGYLSKGTTPEEMCFAVLSVHTGKYYIQQKIAQQIAQKTTLSNTPLSPLTEKEIEIIRMIAEGMDTQTIADRTNIAEKSVHSCRYRIFKKLKLNNDVELAYFAIQHGLFSPNIFPKNLL